MSERSGLWLAAAGLTALLLWIGALALASGLPPSRWLPAMLPPGETDMAALLFYHTMLPRSAVALLAGAALGLAGAMLQQALQNPLASPSTLGVTAGAQLALAAALLWWPQLIGAGRAFVAMSGGAAALGAVLLLSRGSRFSPVTVLLSGVVVALLAGTLAAALSLFNEHSLGGLFIWGSGSLVQDGWAASGQLTFATIAAFCILLASGKAFLLLGLGDTAGSLGLPVARVRLLFVTLAVGLTGVVVGHVGVIGFIGLAAPALCRAAGLRRAFAVALASVPVGGFLLSGTDSLLQILSATAGLSLPTGAVTALFGGPLLILMLRRARGFSAMPAAPPAVRRAARPALVIAVLALFLMAGTVLSLIFNVLPDGHFGFAAREALPGLLPWRWPRILASLSAGALLATSGLILQRLTGNPAASPEILGISAGAALGLTAAVLWLPAPGYGTQIVAAGAGSGLSLTLLAGLAGGRGATPERLLLTGIALSAFVSALMALLMASGDPRMMLIVSWMAGSTYDAEPALAAGLFAALMLFSGLVAMGLRWLDLLPLGAAAARAAGVPLGRARLLLLGLAALMAGAATLATGPLSFAGLMAPHLASRLGLSRALPQMAGAALCGALVMVAADWLGRNLWFPFQIPAGLLASLIGSPALIWLLSKRR